MLEDSVDAVDLRIIRCLQDDPRLPYSTIARIVGVSETTVKRRVDDLLSKRIVRPAMIPNLYRLGYHSRAWIGLTVDLNRIMEIAEKLRNYPDITSVTITAGRFNIVCFAVLESIESLPQFLGDRIAPIDGVRDVEVLVVPRVLKAFADWRVPDELIHEVEDTVPEK